MKREIVYFPVKNMKVTELLGCPVCGAMVPLQFRLIHDAWHAHCEDVAELADAFPFVPLGKRKPFVEDLDATTERALAEPY